ncbi:uncharacterized protein BDR25DRAFT_263686 [Lindgomyces ingoldianus]|uniref:Uncharacterized protein n=1 Tax=Lindgomyces ingoldianus TaxID=673940 RepID=A0ACB6QRT5_9PLEO|nr:uncharacterized protein BDR25DRAFT_263686 [Lindgomyces ingoldianus]KAF2469240.1 hypothetical protein BDR25DRAFT_263686 [Lindgomyces ingoldianus]
MAEAFGIAAGILTVIDLTAKVISKCKHLIETAHDVPRDLRLIFIEISTLKATLESLKYLSDMDLNFPDVVRNLDEIGGAIKGCRDTVEELAAELDGLSFLTPQKSLQAAPSKRRMIKGTLKWCLKEGKARKLLDEAIQHKSTITLALLSEVTRDVKDLKFSIGKLQDGLTDVRQRDVCNWIERTNPTLDHNNAIKLRDEATCRWILRSVEWKNWLAGSNRFLWVYGIPGAGKTILASYIIEQTIQHCPSSQIESTCLYYYCSYRHTEDQTLAFLSWIVSQLCRKLKCVPEDLWELYQINALPIILQLKQGIESGLKKIGQVYIIIDAVDECNTRDDLLQALASFVADPTFARLRILATSRNYLDIESTFRPISEPLSMSNPLVDEDIRMYVASELRANKKFARWSRIFPEMTEALVNGAKGMFRWAACQLHVLQRKRTEADLRKAITELPETLDETYERILLNIPNDDWAIARKALTWICAHEKLYFRTGIPA